VSRIIRVFDIASEILGQAAKYLTFVLIGIISYEVFTRYVLDAPTIWAYESIKMSGGILAVLGFAYVHRHNAHIRVDLLYNKLSPRTQSLIDSVGYFFLFLPLIGALLYTSVIYTWEAWVYDEQLMETFWYPPAGPLRTVVSLGLFILFLEGIAQFIRNLYAVRGKV